MLLSPVRRRFAWWIKAVCIFPVIAGAFFIGRAHASEIHGEAFIVEPAQQEVIRLALMEVGIYREAEMADFIAERRALAAKVANFFDPPAIRASQLFTEADVASKLHEGTRPKLGDFESLLDKVAEFEKATSRFRKTQEILDKARSEAGTKSDYAQGLALYPRTAGWYFEKRPHPLVTVATDSEGRFRLDAPDGSYVLVAHAERSTDSGVESYSWIVHLEVKGETTISLNRDNTAESASRQSLVRTVADPERLGFRAMGGHDLNWLVSLTEPAIVAEAAVARGKAMARYPTLGTPGSRLNVEFLRRLEKYKADRADFLGKADWPIHVADESAAVLGVIPRR